MGNVNLLDITRSEPACTQGGGEKQHVGGAGLDANPPAAQVGEVRESRAP